jgi:hypothetical protein
MTRLVVLKEHGFKQADSSKEDSLAQGAKDQENFNPLNIKV